jgi:hypothetical protein
MSTPIAAHADELEALQSFLIKPGELSVLDSSTAAAVAALPPSLLKQPAFASAPLQPATGTVLRVRVSPSDAKDDEDPTSAPGYAAAMAKAADGWTEADAACVAAGYFYLWLHVYWPAAYPASTDATAGVGGPVIDLDAEHNADYLFRSVRAAIVDKLSAEAKASVGEAVTLTIITTLRDELAKIPAKGMAVTRVLV